MTSEEEALLNDLELATVELEHALGEVDQTIRQNWLEKLRVNVILGLQENPVTMDYGGSSDEGGVEDSNTNDKELDDFLFEFVCIEEDGYWNNDGGGGVVTWDVLSDKITVDHYNNYMSSTDHKYEY